MILTCPECTMRYLVSEGAVGPTGRRVRCASCGHQWFQEPETGLDEALFTNEPDVGFSQIMEDDEEAPFESRHDSDFGEAGDDFHSILQKELDEAPIPEGVKPIHIHDDVVLPKPSQTKTRKVPPQKLGGFATAAIIWALIIGALLVLQPQISRAWPPSNLLYGFVGLKPVPPGEGLSLEGLRAEIGEGKIRMMGDIINLRDAEAKVPAVMATIVDVNDKMIDQILIAPPVARLRPEGRVSFDAAYPKIPDGATNVTYAFSFVKVKAEQEHVIEEPPAHGAPPSDPVKAEQAPQHPAPHH